MLTRRTQLLLDDEQHERLRRLAEERGMSLGALIREAIDEKLAQGRRDARAEAAQRLLAAEPTPVEDWPQMKRQMIEGRYAAPMRSRDLRDEEP